MKWDLIASTIRIRNCIGWVALPPFNESKMRPRNRISDFTSTVFGVSMAPDRKSENSKESNKSGR